MEHLPTFAVLRVRQNTIHPPLAATFPVARSSSIVCYGNMPLAGHIELARLEARTGSPDVVPNRRTPNDESCRWVSICWRDAS